MGFSAPLLGLLKHALSEHLSKYRDCELVLVIAATGEAEEERVVCGICGFVLDEVGECPRCKLINEKSGRHIRAQKEAATEAIFREVERIMSGTDE